MQRIYPSHDNTVVLDGGEERQYQLRVRDLPLDEKPREKLVAQGAATLSVAELLAIVLTTGTKKEDVLSMSSRILKEYGERSLASQRDPVSLAHDLDIPLGKATQVVACAELGRRFFERNDHGTALIRTAKDVFYYTRDMRQLSKEHLRGIYLNAHHRVIHDEIISIGTVDANMVHPREIFKPAIEYAAVAVVLVHNHPSGEVSPSAADIEVTEQVIQSGRMLGIELLDHVIVTRHEYMSVPANYSQ